MAVATTSYRAQTVGSLLRPEYLKEARRAWKQAELPTAEFKRIEDRAVAEAIALQEAAGLDIVTDGEMRREIFIAPLSDALAGVETVAEDVTSLTWHGDDEDAPTSGHRRVVTGKLSRRRPLVEEEFVVARAQATGPVKVTLPSPLLMNFFWSAEHSADAYPDPFEMFDDVAAIMREEVERLLELGCEYVQFDAPELATLIDESVRANYAARGIEPDRVLGEGVEILNSAAGVAGPRYGFHMCRGNREGRWLAEGGYEAISQDVFRRMTNFDTLFLEYDDERSGGFEPLAEVPEDKFVVLGLVSTKRAEVEDPEELLGRIDEASRFFARDRLGISPQCGFASTAEGNPLTLEAQERKLRLVGDVARRAWGD